MDMTVQDIMTSNPACCTKDTPLNQVARLMVEHDCGEIPVTDQAGTLLGVVTDRDICCRAVAQDCNVCNVTAGEIMSSPVVSVYPSTSFERCVGLMEENMIRRIPVVDENGCCCGIVSQADLARKTNGHLVEEVVIQLSQPSEHASNVHD
jgi:CBS domain-containing protein